MSPSRKRILLTIGGAVGLLALFILAAPLLIDVNRYKPRLEAAASDALGMDVRVGGRLGMSFFPGLHVTVANASVLGEHGEVVASVKRARLWIELIPLLRRTVRLRRIELAQPWLSIERDSLGNLNVERLRKAATLLRTLDGASVSVSDGALRYADARSRQWLEATDVDLVVSRMRLAGSEHPKPLRGLSLEAKLACGEIRAKDFSVSALKVAIRGRNGDITLDPITMQIFGGQLTSSMRADLSGAVPRYRFDCSLRQFRVEEFLKTMSPNKAAEGTMDLTLGLSMQGETKNQLVRTAMGEVSLRGRDLTLIGHDLDRELSRYESSQNFNLVDVGAIFLAGPLGLAATKGYNFASLFHGSGGSSRIRTLVSDWSVERGVAQAKDVAMATPENRIALQGQLDFGDGRFADMTVAVIDARGCAIIRQTIRGSFGRPTVEKPHVLRSLAGPMVNLYKEARGLFPASPCEAFYSGTVAPPK
jgi:AsmA protein